MPELPEVESLRHLLVHHLDNARILDVRFLSPVILRGMQPSDFAARIVGKRIVTIERRGKYLVFGLSASNPNSLDYPDGRPDGSRRPDGSSRAESTLVEYGDARLIVHLRMRGSLCVESRNAVPAKYFCGGLELEDGRELRYYDMWRWGEWWLVATAQGVTKISGLDTLGIEPFDPCFTAHYLQERLASRQSALKPLLLGQRVVAGLGNIYCDESLHRAGLHPARKASAVTGAEVARLHKAIVGVLQEAVAYGRAAAERLADRGGNLTEFEGIYLPRVYDRPGRPCPTCGQSLRKISFHGRGTTFCPHCQPDADIA